MLKNKSQNEHFLSAKTKERFLISEKIFKVLTETLNTIHRSKHGERFWKIILAPYVSTVISNYYLLNDTMITVKLVKYPKPNMFKGNNKRRSLSVIDIVKKVRSLNNSKNVTTNLKNYKNIAFGFHYPKAIKPFTDIYFDTMTINHFDNKVEVNLRHVKIQNKEGFKDQFISNIINHIPKIYIENFKDTLKGIELFNPSKKVFHVSMFPNLDLRFVIAKYIDNGAKLNYYQHGGFYGEIKYHNAYLYESSISDNFYTWGWKIGKNDIPFKALRLEKFKDSYKDDLIKEFNILIVYSAFNQLNSTFFKNESLSFFKNINRNEYSKICVRPRLKSKLSRNNDLNFISSFVDKTDSGHSSLHDLISKSRLIIMMNYPSTTMLECLYVNHPVIALFSNDEPTDIIKPYYDYLFRKNILHKNMKSITNFLNSTNIDLWWKELTKESMFMEFKNQFLNKI